MIDVWTVPGAYGAACRQRRPTRVPIEPGFAAITKDASELTTPLSATVSVPVPELPTFNPNLLLHSEPAPVTVTEPCAPALLPMFAAVLVVKLMTCPPFAIVSVPVPKPPILSPPLVPLLQLEFGPVTVTLPFAPAGQSGGGRRHY